MIIYFETQADYVNWLAGSVQTPRVVAYINSVHEYVYRTGDVSNSLVCRDISDINEENTLPYLYDEIISFESNLSQDQPGEVNPDNPGTGEENPVPDEPIYSGMIYEQDAPKTYTKDQLRCVYENYCIIGALLSKDGDNWTVWNTNPSEKEYWNPKSDTITTPSTQYGEVVAVCVGRGLWTKLDWSGLTTGYKWAASSSDAIYNNYHAINIHGNGWESTNQIFTAHSDILTGTIWEQLQKEKTPDYDLYLPSKYELLDIHNNTCDGTHADEQVQGASAHTFNKNLGKLLSLSTVYYWSSSQYASSNSEYYYAQLVNFSNGYVNYNGKTNGFRSVALLHFN